MVNRVEELQLQIQRLEKKLQDTDKTVKRLETTENKIQLTQRTDPAIQLSTNLHDLGLVNEKARVYRTAAQSINTGAITRVEFNLIDYDPKNNYNATTIYSYVVPINGTYLVTSRVGMRSIDPDKYVKAYIYVNGVTKSQGEVNFTSTTAAVLVSSVTDIIELTIGDKVDIRVLHDHGVARDIDNDNYFAIHLISG